MHMQRLRLSDGSWSSLEGDWESQCAKFDETLSDYAGPYFEHAQTIVSEQTADPRYGIFSLVSDECTEKSRKNHAIMHVNRAGLPGTRGWTLRVLWVLLSPEYDYNDISPEMFSSISANLIMGAVHLASDGDLKSEHLKIHLGNLADRTYFRGVAEGLRVSKMFKEFAVRGNWLHIEPECSPVA